MKDTTKNYLTLGLVVMAVCAVIAVKSLKTYETAAGLADDSIVGQGKPVLLELGSHSCVPCKKMMPVLAELDADQTGLLAAGAARFV